LTLFTKLPRGSLVGNSRGKKSEPGYKPGPPPSSRPPKGSGRTLRRDRERAKAGHGQRRSRRHSSRHRRGCHRRTYSRCRKHRLGRRHQERVGKGHISSPRFWAARKDVYPNFTETQTPNLSARLHKFRTLNEWNKSSSEFARPPTPTQSSSTLASCLSKGAEGARGRRGAGTWSDDRIRRGSAPREG
jgi:hypothetical protein